MDAEELIQNDDLLTETQHIVVPADVDTYISKAKSKDDIAITDADFKWYCIRTFTSQEEHLKIAIESEIKRLGLDAYVKEVVVPLETVFEVRNGKKRTKLRNFLPGYLMINAVISDAKKTKNKVLDAIVNITGVVAFVGRKNDPTALQQTEVDKIFSRMEQRADVATIDTTYSIGDPVKVIVGPFAGFSGTISEISMEKRKLKVDIVILGRNTPVELDFEQVQFDKPV
jgi:transcriptional antiterminator NusG